MGDPTNWTLGRRYLERKHREDASLRCITWEGIDDKSREACERIARERLMDRSVEELEAMVVAVLHTGESEHVRVVAAATALTEISYRAKNGGCRHG